MIVCWRSVRVPPEVRDRVLAWIEENRRLRQDHGILFELVLERSSRQNPTKTLQPAEAAPTEEPATSEARFFPARTYVAGLFPQTLGCGRALPVRVRGEGLRSGGRLLPRRSRFPRRVLLGPGRGPGAFFGAASGIIEVVSDSMGLRGPNRLGVSIQVEDVEDVYRHVVNAGLTVERPPENRPWGTREFFLLHPDGHAVTFLEEPPESPRPESRP